MTEARVNTNTADGALLQSRLDAAKEALFAGISHEAFSFRHESRAAKLASWSAALSSLLQGACIAQSAQSNPASISKDPGPAMIDAVE